MDLEHRAAHEVRASGRKLTGYVARFDTEARIGAFTKRSRPERSALRCRLAGTSWH